MTEVSFSQQVDSEGKNGRYKNNIFKYLFLDNDVTANRYRHIFTFSISGYSHKVFNFSRK